MDVSSKKRIVGIIHHLNVGGAERMMVTLLNYFVTQEFEVHLIVFNYQGELKEQFSLEVKVHDLATPSVSKGLFSCLKEIHHIKPHFVFSGIGHLNIALAPFVTLMKRLLPQSKWIARETNIVSLQNQTSKYPKLFDWLYRHCYAHYDLIVAQSIDMKEDLAKNYGIEKDVVVINNPIDVEQVEKASLKTLEHGFDEQKINLITVARLREEKRHDLMLQTMVLLPLEFVLTIVGSGEKEVELKALCVELNLQNRVTFAGNKSNPYPYMKNADLFLLTSQREGFPNVLLEANALGLPIVAFASQGGITEIVKESQNGLTAPFANLEAFAEKIREAHSMNFDKKSIIAMTKERYAKESILAKYEKHLLEELK